MIIKMLKELVCCGNGCQNCVLFSQLLSNITSTSTNTSTSTSISKGTEYTKKLYKYLIYN